MPRVNFEEIDLTLAIQLQAKFDEQLQERKNQEKKGNLHPFYSIIPPAL